MTITFKGTPIMIAGKFPKAGDNAPDFYLTQSLMVPCKDCSHEP